MRRKLQDSDGDRSHIPREERSYIEYHPSLLTHIALTLVRQATCQHGRAGSRGQIPCLTNGRNSISSVSNPPTLNGEAKYDNAQDNDNDTSTASVISNDFREVQRDDMYAFGQITSTEVDETQNDIFAETEGNLFEIDPTLAMDSTDGQPAIPYEVEMAIDPALLDDANDVANTVTLDNSFSVDETNNGTPAAVEVGYPSAADPAQSSVTRIAPSRAAAVLPSDRFLRSEVSVEEKYERLRREEGFSIGKLNEPTFRKIDESVFEHKVKLTSNAIAFGYQADRPFERPEQAYIRTADLSESDLADRVEYDMDEQDEFWLQHYNEQRKLRASDTISREIFEIALTKIEKEWTALEKRIPKPEKKEDAASEDAKCAICDDGECENTNAIVFCDGCNLAVHQECYGVPYIPEGQWLCRKCFASPIDPVSCLFCPSKQGAFKQTSDLHWAHLLCTNWIPEVAVGNPVFMEPIEGISNIPPSRWKLTCYICKLKVGACIQCSNKTCYTSFHVSCARRAKLFLQRNPGNVHSAGKSFCDKHVPEWYRIENDVDTAFVEAQNYLLGHTDPRTHTLASNDVSTRGKFVVSLKRSKQSPVIPAIVFAEILLYMQKFRIRNKAETIADLCKYWSLKRRSRRGASLLKRLQLQIEDNAAQKTDESHTAKRLEFAKALLIELDNFQRPLLEDVMEREVTKKERGDMRDTVVEQIYLPLQPIVHEATAALQDIDSHNLLPLTSAAIKIADPGNLTWLEILQRVNDAQYLSIAMFETDLMTALRNISLVYPENSSREHKLAGKLLEKLPLVLERCRIGERTKALKPTSMIATCFDADFEPDGLILTEEKPFNWANRDTSPLSELDDEFIDNMKEPLQSVTNTCHSASPPRKRSASKIPQSGRSRTDLDSTPAGTLRRKQETTVTSCNNCSKKRLPCDGRDAQCQQYPKHLVQDRALSPADTVDSPGLTLTNKTRKNKRGVTSIVSTRSDRPRRFVAEDVQTTSQPNTPKQQKTVVKKHNQTPDRLSRSAARKLGESTKRKVEEVIAERTHQPDAKIKRPRRRKD